MAARKSPLSLLDLPPELLNLIVSKLWISPVALDADPEILEAGDELLDDIRSIRLVCKRLQSVALPYMYRFPLFDDYKEMVRFTKHVQNRAHVQPLVRGIYVKSEMVNTPKVPFGFQMFANMRELRLCGAAISAAILSLLPSRCDLFPLLEVCTISSYSTSIPGAYFPDVVITLDLLLPIVSAPRLKRFAIGGYDIILRASNYYFTEEPMRCSNRTIRWPQKVSRGAPTSVPTNLPDLEVLRFEESELAPDFIRAAGSLRGAKQLIVKLYYNLPDSTARGLVDAFATSVQALWYDNLPRELLLPFPLSFEHCVRLRRLRIRAESLCCLFIDFARDGYAPLERHRQLCVAFPSTLEHLAIDIQPSTTHRGALYQSLSAIIGDSSLHLPKLKTLRAECCGNIMTVYPSDAVIADENRLRNGWSWAWNHHRVAPAEVNFAQTEDGGETRECRQLRSACEHRNVRLDAIDEVCPGPDQGWLQV